MFIFIEHVLHSTYIKENIFVIKGNYIIFYNYNIILLICDLIGFNIYDELIWKISLNV